MADTIVYKYKFTDPMILIRFFEGCKLKAYLCSAGVPTIGWGNTTYPNGSKVKLGDVIDQATADAMLLNYYTKEVKPLLDLLPMFVTTTQKVALASLIFNWNMRGVKSSKLLSAIITKDYPNIAREWDYGYNNGRGLVKRRVKELEIFTSDIDTW